MILKNYIQFINETLDNDKEIIFKFEIDCRECEGTGEDTMTCYDCGGSGNDQYSGDEYSCSECGGSGELDSDCGSCMGERKDFIYIEYRIGEGVNNIHTKYGNADHPVENKEIGKIVYEKEDTFSEEAKDIVKFIFNNKNLSIPDMTNSLVRFMIKKNYHKDFNISDKMKDLLNDDTKRIINSTNTINKFKL